MVIENQYHNSDIQKSIFKASPFNGGNVPTNVNPNIRNLLTARIVYNNSTRDGEVKQESAYKYDANGNLLAVAKHYSDGTNDRWIITRNTYDIYGNLLKTTNPNGSIVEREYDTEYSSAYPTTIKKSLLKDADDKLISDVVYRYGYNDMGLKKWEVNPLGYVTEYEYDNLKRLIKVVYPQEEDRIKGDFSTLSITSLEGKIINRVDDPVKIQYYDDANDALTVMNAENNITVTASMANNNLITICN